MKLVLNARAEAVVVADAEGTAVVMVEEAADAAAMVEVVVAAAEEDAAVTAVAAGAIVNSNLMTLTVRRARSFFRAPFLCGPRSDGIQSKRRRSVALPTPFSSVFRLPRFFRSCTQNASESQRAALA